MRGGGDSRKKEETDSHKELERKGGRKEGRERRKQRKGGTTKPKPLHQNGEPVLEGVPMEDPPCPGIGRAATY